MQPRVGFCGAGRIARFHANGFRAAGAVIAAFADPVQSSAETVAAGYGARIYPDLTDMIAAEALDILCIATPHHLHAPQAETAMTAGLDVFLDKPLALTARDGEELAAMARRLGRIIGVNHNLLFHPAVDLARDLIRDGKLGRIVSAMGWSTGWLTMAEHDFRLDRASTGGGAWFDAGPHLLYTLQDLVGPISRVRAVAAAGESRLGGEDTVVATVSFAQGAVAALRISYAHVAPGSRLDWPMGWAQGIEINGTKGAVRLVVSPVGKVDYFDGGTGDWHALATGLQFSASFDGCIADFLAARSVGKTGRVGADASVQILRLIGSALE